MRLRTFLRMAMGVGAINLIERALSVVLGVVIARWLGAEGYGNYAYVMAWVLVLNIPAQFGLANLLMRDLAIARSEKGQVDVRSLLRHSARLVLILSCSTAAVGIAAAVLLLPAGERGMLPMLVIGFTGLPMLAMLEVYTSAWRGLGRPLATQFFGVLLPTIVVLLLTSIAVWLLGKGTHVNVALLCRFTGLATSLLAALFLLHRHLSRLGPEIRTSPRTAKQSLQVALPFMLITGANIILSRTDVVMIGLLASQRKVGLFNAGLQAALLAQFGLAVSNSIVAPEFARLHANGETGKLQYLAVSTARMVLVFGLGVLLVLLLFGKSLLGLMFGAEFQAAAPAMSILVIGQSISLLFGEPGFLLNMTGNQTLTLRLVGGTSVLNVALNALLIPVAGIEGAALSTSISLVTWRALAYLSVRRRLGIGCAVFSRAGQ